MICVWYNNYEGDIIDMLYYEVIDNCKDKWIMFLHSIYENNDCFREKIDEYSKYYNLIFIDLPRT